MHAYIHACVRTDVCTYVRMNMTICMYIYEKRFTGVYICVCVYVFMCICVYVYMYIMRISIGVYLYVYVVCKVRAFNLKCCCEAPVVLFSKVATGKRLCHAHVMPGGFPPSKRSITKVTPKSCLSLFPHLNACATDSKHTRKHGLNQGLLW